jgi:hypothetical protein
VTTRPADVVQEVVDRFFEIFIDAGKFIEAKKMYSFMNHEEFLHWVHTRSTIQINQMEGMEQMITALWKYATSIKGKYKVNVARNPNTEIPAGQTLTVMQQLGTALFAPDFGTFARMLTYSLKDKWLINKDVTKEELSAHANRLMKNQTKVRTHEVDISKFDKSQEELTLSANLEILKRFGMPDWTRQLWFDVHQTNILIFYELGLRIITHFQRRSGDIFTFLGNTLTTMLALGYCFPYELAIGGMFGGDDALAIFPSDVIIPDNTDYGQGVQPNFKNRKF